MHRSLRLDEVAAPLVRSRLCARVAEPLALRLHGALSPFHSIGETLPRLPSLLDGCRKHVRTLCLLQALIKSSGDMLEFGL